MELKLRKTVIGGETAPDDYAVIDGGQSVGRIRRAAERNGEVWLWNVTVNIPGAANGTASGLDQAKEAFRAAWTRRSNDMVAPLRRANRHATQTDYNA